jgi:ATP-dependent helicase/nuclease subunit B
MQSKIHSDITPLRSLVRSEQVSPMAQITTLAMGQGLTVPQLWQAAAQAAQRWLADLRLPARDAIVLLPFAALLPPAREAFARSGGWQPRIETPLTLAAALGPPPPVPAPAITGDLVIDRLRAADLLRTQRWSAAWQRRDRRVFDRCVADLTAAAQELRRAAQSRSPAARAGFGDALRGATGAAGGTGALESALLAVARHWAAVEAPAATDALYRLEPSAWVTLKIGGSDPLIDSLLEQASCPALSLDADPDPDAPFAVAAWSPAQRRFVCSGIEAEAQAAAAEAIGALNAGLAPVALIATDRVLTRRVKALLARQRVAVADETGTRASTTAAAAALMALLRAAAEGAPADAKLDWLKTLPLSEGDAALIDTLEALWRGKRFVPGADRAGAAQALWRRESQRLAPWAARRERPLTEWLALLDAGLPGDRGGEMRSVCAALRVGFEPEGFAPLAAAQRLDLPGFAAWVDSVLDATNIEPPRPAAAEVVITPLARAIGRPFGAAVLPGADHRRLGGADEPPSLIGKALAEQLGLERHEARARRERLAVAQLLRLPSLVISRRRVDLDEPLAPSPIVEWIALERLRAGAGGLPETEWHPALDARPRRPVRRPLPTAARILPTQLSPSAIETLRQCPYRFYARSVLRLEESAELDAPLAKRDYGEWLHAVLHRFHRDAGDGAAVDASTLFAAAAAVSRETGIDPAELMPFEASFAAFVPAYLRWLQARSAAGWRWRAGELDLEFAPENLLPQQLRGRLDRIDRGPGGVLQVIDYKTANVEDLKRRVRDQLEDTQLAAYALLAAANGQAEGPVEAMYLALDDPKAPLEVPHHGVMDTAHDFLLGVAADFVRLRGGAPLPALGEGRACELCEARGLCRRDHWAAAGGGA